MKAKTIKIWYWIVTILFSAAMLMSGILELLQTEQGKEVMIHLGYPLYLNIILGVAKILGVIALVQGKFRIIKEWAYAGFTIDIIGASASMAFAGDAVLLVLSPALFLVVIFSSYLLWKKTEKI